MNAKRPPWQYMAHTHEACTYSDDRCGFGFLPRPSTNCVAGDIMRSAGLAGAVAPEMPWRAGGAGNRAPTRSAGGVFLRCSK